jgi:hypothetical protein
MEFQSRSWLAQNTSHRMGKSPCWLCIANKKFGIMSHLGASGGATKGDPAEAPTLAMDFHGYMTHGVAR